jgi:outer membrane protein assembly factor BamA
MFYGIIISLYDYDDGSRYPDYMQTIRFQLARYTRGSSEHYLDYDSYTLLPGVEFKTGIRYVGNQAFPFYGFNGNAANYNHAWEVDEDPAYKSRMFFRQDRRAFQLYANIQDTIGKSKFQWHAGWSMSNFKIDTVNIAKLNRKLDAGEKLPFTPSLYQQYTDWGIIRESEKRGGLANSFLVGLIYDSRNRLTNPDKGIFTELNIRWMPSFLSTNHFSGLNIGLIHKQYLNIIKNRLIFAYRIWINTNLGGDQSYFTRQLLTTFSSTEGYGGAGTMRGVLLNRIVTSDFIFGNFELRSRLINFRFIKQNWWYLGAVAFMDAGRILKPVKIDITNVPSAARSEFFSVTDKSLHKSLGGGLKLVMNENTVLSAEYARPFDPQDGISGLYLGFDYLF